MLLKKIIKITAVILILTQTAFAIGFTKDNSTIEEKKENNKNNFIHSQEISHAFIGLGEKLNATDSPSILNSMAIKTASDLTSQAFEQYFNHFGNTRISLGLNENMEYYHSNIDLLLPLDNIDGNHLLFTQFGFTDRDYYTTVNLGIGQRNFFDTQMFGYNLFLDHEISNNHTRIGTGIEYWQDYLKLAANSYIGISGWKTSKELQDYEERPASGYDLRADAWLPNLPQLGGKLSLDQYFGNQVGRNGPDERKRNPITITAGLNYTPVPLLTIGAEQQLNSGKNDTQVSLQFNYQPGVRLEQQISADYVNERRTLLGSRLDFVDRNNAMVMEYRKMEVIKLSLPVSLNGETRQAVTIQAKVKSRHGLNHIEWNTGRLKAAGAHVTAIQGDSLSLLLPTSAGVYSLDAVAHDNHGNASNSATMSINVTQGASQPSVQISELIASPLQQNANGSDVITYSLTAIRNDGTPARNIRVQWHSSLGNVISPQSTTDDAGKAQTTISSSEPGKVQLTATLMDSNSKQIVERTDSSAEFIASQNTLRVSLKSDYAKSWAESGFTRTLTAHVTDAQGKAVANKAMLWDLSQCSSCTVYSTSPISDNDGNFSSPFGSTDIGKQKLKICLQDNEDICAETEIEILATPKLRYRVKGDSTWQTGDWKNKPLLQSGNIELTLGEEYDDTQWQSGSGISINTSSDLATAVLIAPTSSMTISSTVFADEPKMRRMNQLHLSGQVVTLSNEGVNKMLYSDARQICTSLAASEITESQGQEIYNVWGDIHNSATGYVANFSPWLEGTLGYDPGSSTNAKALNMSTGVTITALNTRRVSQHALCIK
jgi:adhesin/invasin